MKLQHRVMKKRPKQTSQMSLHIERTDLTTADILWHNPDKIPPSAVRIRSSSWPKHSTRVKTISLMDFYLLAGVPQHLPDCPSWLWWWRPQVSPSLSSSPRPPKRRQGEWNTECLLQWLFSNSYTIFSQHKQTFLKLVLICFWMGKWLPAYLEAEEWAGLAGHGWLLA